MDKHNCPRCCGDGCEPTDYGTAIFADCLCCGGEGKLTNKQLALYEIGMIEKWTWER